jgi:hypothetical protein
MTEDDFTALGQHLQTLNPIIAEFCKRHGFERIVGPSVGRYPRIRLQRTDAITRWIDLWMGFDEAGHRFTSFTADLPYELSAGAFFDEPTTGPSQWRYQKAFLIWPALPFREVADKLAKALESGVAALEEWDATFLQTEGKRVTLG